MEQVSKLYVGNLDYNTTEDELKAHFEQKGIAVIMTQTLMKDIDDSTQLARKIFQTFPGREG